ncbi:MAG TPA: flagellar protein FlaG [Limnochordales bacterium]
MRVPEVAAGRNVAWNPSLQERVYVPVNPPTRTEERTQPVESGDRRAPYDRTVLDRIADGLNRTLEAVDKRLKFLVHEETDRIYVKVIDEETGEVIREIPPEKILDLVGHIQKLIGLLIDEWA